MEKYNDCSSDIGISRLSIRPFPCLDACCRASFNNWYELSNHIERQHNGLLQSIQEVHQVAQVSNTRATPTSQLIDNFNNAADQCFISERPKLETQDCFVTDSASPRSGHGSDCHRDLVTTFTHAEPWSAMNMRSQQDSSKMNGHK